MTPYSLRQGLLDRDTLKDPRWVIKPAEESQRNMLVACKSYLVLGFVRIRAELGFSVKDVQSGYLTAKRSLVIMMRQCGLQPSALRRDWGDFDDSLKPEVDLPKALLQYIEWHSGNV